MSIAEWTELSAVMDRIHDLKSHAQAAVMAGDFNTAAHFFGLVERAEEERERTLGRILPTSA
jgi:endonuclease/exonuclease/phosphatase (EEP) superfamily protein YafD